jgi:hypothetical protein
MTALFIMALGTANAQTSSADDTNVNKGAGSIETVKLIDNKGTIKYLQSNNGITSITSTNAGSATTTTFQLGGILIDNTIIDVNGKVFALDRIALSSAAASTDATSLSLAGTGTGYTFLVRNEATGATEKIMLDTLLESAYTIKTVDSDFITNATITIAGIVTLPTAKEKISLFRNGSKLRSGTDYTLASNEITLVPQNSSDAQAWALYVGDIIEVNILNF